MTTNDDIKARVERARELDKLATPGPWGFYHPMEFPKDWRIMTGPNERPYWIGRLTKAHMSGLGSDPPREEDARFIAESRTLLPALAADCERLQARVSELEAAARLDDSLEATAQRLIGAAHAYWKRLGSEIGQRAVIWLEDTSGRLVIFTRGEYREQLMRNIGLINGPHYFAKTGPDQED